jgi:broad specificity phosphatase PhoE
MEIVQKSFNSDTSKTLWVDLHEYGGRLDGKSGLNTEEIKACSADIKFEDNVDLDSGWWKYELRESDEAFKERVKKVITKLKEMSSQLEDDYTICLITHGYFLNAVFTILNNCELLYNSIQF